MSPLPFLFHDDLASHGRVERVILSTTINSLHRAGRVINKSAMRQPATIDKQSTGASIRLDGAVRAATTVPRGHLVRAKGRSGAAEEAKMKSNRNRGCLAGLAISVLGFTATPIEANVNDDAEDVRGRRATR